MERTSVEEASKIFGKNFIGPSALKTFFESIGKSLESLNVPEINFTKEVLERLADKYILFLGVKSTDEAWEVNIKNLKSIFGSNSLISEPCFYNQDWYESQNFISEMVENKWYLIKKDVFVESRSKLPENILIESNNVQFPSAVICTYIFFIWYLVRNEILWKYDFVWCSDKDFNGDRIYVGKYKDIGGLNKNGFSIHRHLSLRTCYGAIDCI
jgi:hypothetical protein